jgi:hypothetical protein
MGVRTNGTRSRRLGIMKHPRISPWKEEGVEEGVEV